MSTGCWAMPLALRRLCLYVPTSASKVEKSTKERTLQHFHPKTNLNKPLPLQHSLIWPTESASHKILSICCLCTGSWDMWVHALALKRSISDPIVYRLPGYKPHWFSKTDILRVWSFWRRSQGLGCPEWGTNPSLLRESLGSEVLPYCVSQSQRRDFGETVSLLLLPNLDVVLSSLVKISQVSASFQFSTGIILYVIVDLIRL